MLGARQTSASRKDRKTVSSTTGTAGAISGAMALLKARRRKLWESGQYPQFDSVASCGAIAAEPDVLADASAPLTPDELVALREHLQTLSALPSLNDLIAALQPVFDQRRLAASSAPDRPRTVVCEACDLLDMTCQDGEEEHPGYAAAVSAGSVRHRELGRCMAPGAKRAVVEIGAPRKCWLFVRREP